VVLGSKSTRSLGLVDPVVGWGGIPLGSVHPRAKPFIMVHPIFHWIQAHLGANNYDSDFVIREISDLANYQTLPKLGLIREHSFTSRWHEIIRGCSLRLDTKTPSWNASDSKKTW